MDALRKIEAGVNGAKIDTLISIAELFHIVNGILFGILISARDEYQTSKGWVKVGDITIQ